MTTTQRIAVSVASAAGLDAQVFPHFGRAPYFTLVTLTDQEVTEATSVANPYFNQHQPGQVPGFIHSQGADVMISGGMGGRAVDFFAQYGIAVATGAQGTVREVLDRYVRGKLQGAAPCAESVAHGHA